MKKIFITGSSDGLGALAAKMITGLGHNVVLHARNAERAKVAMKKCPNAEKVLVADLSSLEETKRLALEANEVGPFDAVIHNAGIYQVPAKAISKEGWPLIFAVNSLAPYVLTCLMHPPARLVYLSSGMHLGGNADVSGLTIERLRSGVAPSYSDSKAFVTLLANVVARKWPRVYSNSVDPGWVPTKMGGAGAPGDLTMGTETQVWLATSEEPEAKVSGKYFHHQKQKPYLPATGDPQLQERFLKLCEEISELKLNG